MSSLVSAESMQRLYEESGATVIREPWGRPYDETVGPLPIPQKRPPYPSAVFPDDAMNVA